MAKAWPGFKERLEGCIRDAGYKNAAQFADANGIRITYIYKWLGGTTPDRANLTRLARIFKVAPAWLLFGDEVQREPFKKLLVSLLLGLTTASMVPAHSTAAIPTREPGASSDNNRPQVLENTAVGYEDYVNPAKWLRNLIGYLRLSGFPRLTACAA